jgi:Xaa-Pro aminopeptidase
MRIGDRLPRFRALLGEREFPPAALVTSLVNVQYLTGFTGSAGMLFVLPSEAVLLTDGRYRTQAEEQMAAAGADVRVDVSPAAGQADRAGQIVADAGIEELVLESAHVSWARLMAFRETWFAGVELVPSLGLVETLRQIKDDGELDRLEQAARIADEALANVRPQLMAGVSERYFGLALDSEMRRLGASAPSFETIVASGPNGAKPHHRPDGRVVGSGDLVVLDFGARFESYCSDMTRTVWVSAVDQPDLRRAVDVVREAQAAGVAAVGPGVACVDVDRACRQVIAAAGWAEYFVHGTGHGVGLEIHEAPSVSAASTDTLAAGHVVTVEPGVYLPGLGGVRIEDTVVVTDGGCRPLNHTPKDHL